MFGLGRLVEGAADFVGGSMRVAGRAVESVGKATKECLEDAEEVVVTVYEDAVDFIDGD